MHMQNDGADLEQKIADAEKSVRDTYQALRTLAHADHPWDDPDGLYYELNTVSAYEQELGVAMPKDTPYLTTLAYANLLREMITEKVPDRDGSVRYGLDEKLRDDFENATREAESAMELMLSEASNYLEHHGLSRDVQQSVSADTQTASQRISKHGSLAYDEVREKLDQQVTSSYAEFKRTLERIEAGDRTDLAGAYRAMYRLLEASDASLRLATVQAALDIMTPGRN